MRLPERGDAMSFMDVSDDALRSRWKWFVGFGVALLIFGLIALWNVVDATLITTVLVGFMILFGGIAQLIAAFASSGSMGWRILGAIVGILFIIVGIDVIADPMRGAVALTVVIAIVLIADGIIRLISVFSSENRHRLLSGVVGVINILLGLWLWTGIPYTGVAIGFFVGIELIMAGILWIAGGWMARKLPAMASAY
jgi:uncharacterized membrane protein HdeD (DUF308 family)